MIIAGCLLALTVVSSAVNKRNAATLSAETLSFSGADSRIIFACIMSALLLQFLVGRIPILSAHALPLAAVTTGVYACTFVVVNVHRERIMAERHQQALTILQALVDVFGRVDPKKIDMSALPFTWECDSKLKCVSKIIIDTTQEGVKVNDGSITYGQYSLNKYIPQLQWTALDDAPNRQLIFTGLPKPPQVAKWVGSDYRPGGWIPVGLAGGNMEVCLNIADEKDHGMSMWVDEDGVQAGTLDMPSAPQVMTLGSTGGGKAIALTQMVEVICEGKGE